MSEQQQLKQEITESGLFDEAWYLENYPDVALVGLSPLEHFARFGIMMKRDPGPGFSTQYYLDVYTDVAQEQVDPFLHYIRYGKFEGRRAVGDR